MKVNVMLTQMSACVYLRVYVGEWGRSAQEGHSEVSGSDRRKCYRQVDSWFLYFHVINSILYKKVLILRV